MERNTTDTICMIKEQGDLSLFADPISEEDQEKIEENFNKAVKNEKEDN